MAPKWERSARFANAVKTGITNRLPGLCLIPANALINGQHIRFRGVELVAITQLKKSVANLIVAATGPRVAGRPAAVRR